MPVDMKRRPVNWPEIAAQIRTRSKDRCEWCAATNYQPHPVTGSQVTLTIAHLGTSHADGRPGNKHDTLDCRLENLARLCQRCHLRYDQDERHASAAATRRRRKIKAGQQEMPL